MQNRKDDHASFRFSDGLSVTLYSDSESHTERWNEASTAATPCTSDHWALVSFRAPFALAYGGRR